MHLLLAVQNNQIVGMISWTLTHELYSADTRVYISDVSVDHAARGQGIGTALMAEAKAWAVPTTLQSPAGRFGTETLPPRRFYERLGASIDEEAIPYLLALEGEER